MSTSTRQHMFGFSGELASPSIVVAPLGTGPGMDIPSSSGSDYTSEDEQLVGVPLSESHDHGMVIDHEEADMPFTLHQSRHDANDLLHPSSTSTGELRQYSTSSSSDSTQRSSDTERETGLRVNEEHLSGLTRATEGNSNTAFTRSSQPIIRLGSPSEDHLDRVHEELGESTSDGDANANLETAPHGNSLAPEQLTVEARYPFFDLFDPERLDPGGASKNLSVANFLRTWRDKRAFQLPNYPKSRIDYLPPINLKIDPLKLAKALKESAVITSRLGTEYCNFQGLNWKALGTTKHAVQEARRKTYLHHTNLMSAQLSPQYADINGPSRFRRHTKLDGQGWAKDVPDIPTHDSHFLFRQMNLRCKPRLTHFQLRHILSASSKNGVFYAGERKVLCLNPETEIVECIMHFKESHADFEGFPMKDIATLTATHDLLIVGGFVGQYAMKSLLTSNDNDYVKGRITTAERDGSTNHIHTFQSRQSGLPRVAFCSNDDHVRILDCFTNVIVDEHNIGWAINCSATSPDGRLRLMVGDQTEPWVVDADTGKRLLSLPNHKDFGFACDWAPDSLHVATGNQDGIVQIFDCRNWARAIQVLPTELGGVRTMKFSPLGSGKRVLAMAEPADFVSIVDAETFKSKQRFEFLGEIGGLSFTPDGSKLFVANTDQDFGGILEFDRAGDGQRYGLARPNPCSEDDEWIVDQDIHLDDELLHSSTKRKRRCWGLGDVHI